MRRLSVLKTYQSESQLELAVSRSNKGEETKPLSFHRFFYKYINMLLNKLHEISNEV